MTNDSHLQTVEFRPAPRWLSGRKTISSSRKSMRCATQRWPSGWRMLRRYWFLLMLGIGAMRQTFIFFVQAIARIMADKVYTSAEFKRERDNFQVNDFHRFFLIDNKLWFAGPLQGSWAYWGEEVAQPDPRDPDGREGQVPAGDREWEAECAH